MKLISIVDVLLVQRGRVLLVQQKKPSAYGMWSLPGGHVETGESPREAIMREISEELAVTLREDLIVTTSTHVERKTSEGGLEVTTFVANWPDSITIIQEEELIGLGWFGAEDVTYIAPRLYSPWILPLAKSLLDKQQEQYLRA